MKVKFNILYNNGETEEIIQETTQGELDEMGEVINASFTEDFPAVMRLNSEEEANFVKLSHVSRVKIVKVK